METGTNVWQPCLFDPALGEKATTTATQGIPPCSCCETGRLPGCRHCRRRPRRNFTMTSEQAAKLSESLDCVWRSESWPCSGGLFMEFNAQLMVNLVKLLDVAFGWNFTCAPLSGRFWCQTSIGEHNSTINLSKPKKRHREFPGGNRWIITTWDVIFKQVHAWENG